ncbi:MAG: T9SS type A sorting domain-containing protein [Bacteroidia bacterium]
MKKTILSLAFGICLSVTGLAQVPFSQNFTVTTTGTLTTTPPSGWTSTTTASVTPKIEWKFGDSATTGSTNFIPPNHGVFAILNSDSAGDATPSIYTQTLCDAWLKTPVITGIPAGTYLSFDYYFRHSSCISYGGNPSPTLPYEIFVVHVSTDGGSTWAVLDSVPGITINAWATQHVSLSAYSGMNIMLGFEYNNGSTWMNGAAFTNLNVYVPPANDITYTSIAPVAGTPASYVLAGSSASISGVVTNVGGSPITTYTASYFDGTTTHSSVITASITPYTTGSFTIATPYTVTLGNHPIKSWVTLTGDATHTDDTLNTVLVGAAFLPTHQLTIEEATGCWCGWCPRGTVYMDSMHIAHPTGVSLIAVHDIQGGAVDPMGVAVYDNGITALPGFTGFPAIAVDRKEILDPSQIFQGYTDHASDFGFATLTLNTTSTGTTSISATASVVPAVNLSGTYQLALVLTEENVHNTATTYGQHDYYSGGANGPLNDVTIGVNFAAVYTNSIVPAASMKYNHVARSISGSFNGVPSSLPASMTAGTTYTYSFGSTAMTAWNSNNLRAILLLIDATSGYVLNSVSTNMGLTGIAQNNSNIVAVSVFPNPANSSFNMDINLTTSEKTSITLYNVMGQEVSTKNYDFSAGENIINIPTDQLATGMYMVLVSSSKGIYQTKINVIK